MDHWIAPDRMFDGRGLRTGQALRIVDGCITEIGSRPSGARRLGGVVTPGYVDLQVNGGGGVLLNNTPTAEGIKTILSAHRSFGTVGLMPTVITDTPAVLDHAADAAIKTRDVPGMMGLHIEGPHISLGRRGTHLARFVRPLDDQTLATVARLRAARVRVMITLAPEAATLEQISKLAGMGAVVSLGHTDADATAIRAALSAGASCATHLFNAMSPMQSREPGAVGAIINSTGYAGIICDGQHVDDGMVGMAIRARAVPDRMFLVSDAMATVGGPDHFMLYGQKIGLRDGRLINDEGSLAGAHVTQAIGVKRLVEKTGTPLAQALSMATSCPANCIGAPGLGQLIGREVADILVLNDDLTVQATLDDILVPDEMSDGAR